MRRIPGFLLAAQLVVGVLLPFCALAEPGGAMACCMMDGRCDCAHDDASFSRCRDESVLATAASQPASPAASFEVRTALPLRELLAAFREEAAESLRPDPPTPPPRAAV